MTKSAELVIPAQGGNPDRGTDSRLRGNDAQPRIYVLTMHVLESIIIVCSGGLLQSDRLRENRRRHERSIENGH